MSRYQIVRADLTFSMHHPWVRAGLASALVASMVFMVVALFYWRPIHQEEVQLSGQIRRQRTELVRAMQDAALARTYASTRKAVGQLEGKLDAESGQAALVNNVTALAQRSHVSVIGESYQEGQGQDGYVPLYQVIALQGDYRDVRQFLFGVNDLPTWTVVQETRLERMHAGGGVKATLTLVTYRKTKKKINS